MNKLLCEILSICYEITQQTVAHCFFSYDAHIDSYTVRYYEAGWSSGMSLEECKKVYVSCCSKITEEDLSITKQKLLDIAKERGVVLEEVIA